jgi:nicotinate-nucleotide--dimethylbenzimidazole phosphoribosyltransferase
MRWSCPLGAPGIHERADRPRLLRVRRPQLSEDLDPSRAAARAADPAGWRMDDASRAALEAVIAGRRDVRRFRPDPVPDDVLDRLLTAAHRAPSVGLSQPWRFVVVRDDDVRAQVRALAETERVRQASRFDERARAFLDQKVEGILEAPLGIAVCCVPPAGGVEVLGRGTIPETDLHSTVCAIQNLWLTARAEGLGVGWVSFYRPADLRAVLGIPEAVDPVAWLCVGWPDERPTRPGLERAGWGARQPLASVVFHDRWPGAGEDATAPGPAPSPAARTAARDHADALVKPVGSLGQLEDVVERWAAATGAPPPAPLRAAHLVVAADHGHVERGTSLFGARVSGEVAAAAARGQTAIGVLAAARGERLTVADVGLRDATPDGCVDLHVARGTADFVTGAAMAATERDAAVATGARLAEAALGAEPAADCLVLGEIGIGNTTTAAALLCALTGTAPEDAAGRGSGLDAQGLARKRATIAAALARHGAAADQDHQHETAEVLRRLGGLELAALVGAIHAAHDARVPVLLDGFTVGVAALIAVRLRPACREWLFAGHRSAEPAHARVLLELGLEPLLDLRLRLGEGSGAALALPLIEQAGILHTRMATFDEAGVSGP